MELDVERVLRKAQRRRGPLLYDELASFFRVVPGRLSELMRLDGFPSPSTASGRPTWDPVELRRWRNHDWMAAANRALYDVGDRTPPFPPEYWRAPLPPRYGAGPLGCSFCRREHAEVRKLIAGPAVAICSDCVEHADATGSAYSFEAWRKTVVEPSSAVPLDERDGEARLRQFWEASQRLHAAVIDRGYLLIRDFPEFLGRPADVCREIARREDFPAPVKTVGEQAVWSRADVERWCRSTRTKRR
jgi:ClpX C4-type zinc finger